MLEWNLRCIFICALVQTISAEWASDGKTLFFGLPVSRDTSKANSTSPVHALLKSTFLLSDSNDGDNQNPVYTVIPEEDDMPGKPETESVPVGPTEIYSMKSPDSGIGNEFPREDVDMAIPNLLQTDATASTSQRQPMSGSTLASLIRYVVGLARPLVIQQPTSIKSLFSKSNRDPLRDLISLAEVLVGRVGNTIAKQNSVDFLNLIDSMQSAVDRMGGDGDCNAIVELMDQTLITFKELMEMLRAVQELGEMWRTTNISTLRNCITKPGATHIGSSQTSDKKSSIVSR